MITTIWPLLTWLASEKCQQEKRKTVNGEDVLFAMTSLGFENYSEALKIYLARYREVSHSFDFIPSAVKPKLSIERIGEQNHTGSKEKTPFSYIVAWQSGIP